MIRNIRRLSQDVLRNWNPDTGFAASLLENAARKNELSARDRAFLQSMVMGVLRNLNLLDHWVDHLRGKGALKGKLRWLLRQGLYEVVLMRTPDHAAVSQTVKLAKKFEKGLVNAVMRRAVTELDSLRAGIEALPWSTRFSLPKFLITKWRAELGDDATLALLEWMNEPANVTLRANLLCDNAGERLRVEFGARPLEDQPGFFVTQDLPLKAIAAGLCYVQDPSTVTAPELLAPRPSEVVLDACAAPGGKSAILAAHMQNKGRLVAVDNQQARIDMTRGNLDRLGVTCAETVLHDWLSNTALPEAIAREKFDRVLLDVPCSNTGVMRRRVDVRWRLTASAIVSMQETQLQIAEQVLPHLKPGGTLVYSTCSIEAEENQQVVARILEQHPELSLTEDASILPHLNDTDGAYAAKLTKSAP